MSKEKALIEIRLVGLTQGVHEFEFSRKAADFDDPALSDAGFSQGISIGVTVEKLEGELVVTMRTTAIADLVCDLCLAPLSVELDGSYRVYYGYEHSGLKDEERDEDYRIFDKNTLSIDLTEDVRETLLLSVPLKVTCKNNPECRVFQQDKAIKKVEDPIPDNSWEDSLGKLKNKFC